MAEEAGRYFFQDDNDDAPDFNLLVPGARITTHEWPGGEPGPEMIVEDAAKYDALVASRSRLLAALNDAIEFADSGWQYADTYYHEKWGFEAEIARLRAVVAAETKRSEE